VVVVSVSVQIETAGGSLSATDIPKTIKPHGFFGGGWKKAWGIETELISADKLPVATYAYGHSAVIVEPHYASYKGGFGVRIGYFY